MLEPITWRVPAGGAARTAFDRRAVIVRLRNNAGRVGVGEAAPLLGHSRETVHDAMSELAPLAGAATEAAVQHLCATASSASVRFALSCALAQLAAQPGQPIYGSVQWAAVVDDVADARAAEGAGASALKVKVGPSDWPRLIAISSATRLPVRVDANRSWPRDTVAAKLADCARLGIVYVEEPCAPPLLGEATPVPLAFDESFGELLPAERLRFARALPSGSIIVMKPTVLGAIDEVVKLVADVHQLGLVAILSHALESPIGQAACTALARRIGGGPHGVAPPDEAPGNAVY